MYKNIDEKNHWLLKINMHTADRKEKKEKWKEKNKESFRCLATREEKYKMILDWYDT